jgi:hypothetical protein
MTEKKSSMGGMVFKGIGLFVVIVAGIYVGFWISVKSGLTDSLSGRSALPQQLNQTNVKAGDQFPTISALDVSGEEVSLEPVIDGQKTILAFLSGTCEPCLMLAGDLPGFQAVRSGEYRVVILSESPEVYRESGEFDVYGSRFEVIDSLNVRAFPTVFVIDESGVVEHVSAGYSQGAGERVIMGRIQEEGA